VHVLNIVLNIISCLLDYDTVLYDTVTAVAGPLLQQASQPLLQREREKRYRSAAEANLALQAFASGNF